MSIGFAFAKGLIGGFQKNIETEQGLRGLDDQRLAKLQDALFTGTLDAAKSGKPVPQHLGAALRRGKKQLSEREGINLFGTNTAPRLDIDLTGLSGVLNESSIRNKYTN